MRLTKSRIRLYKIHPQIAPLADQLASFSALPAFGSFANCAASSAILSAAWASPSGLLVVVGLGFCFRQGDELLEQLLLGRRERRLLDGLLTAVPACSASARIRTYPARSSRAVLVQVSISRNLR